MTTSKCRGFYSKRIFAPTIYMKNLIKFIRNLFSKKKEIKEVDWRDGLLPSPTDFRDIPLSAVSKITAPTPEKYRIPYVLTIKNQGNSPHCVGYACAAIKEYLERKEGNFIEFDGDWIYNECKKIDGIPNIQGTYFRSGLKVLKDTGAKPLNGKEEDAYKYRIGGYASVDCDFNSLKRAIYEFGAILMGFIGSDGGWQFAVIRAPKSGEIQWGHATTGIGFEITLINGQNSWGEQWGEKGLFHFLESYKPFEAWAVLVDLPNDWKELLSNEDLKPKYFFQNNLSVGIRNDEVKILQDCLKFLGCLSKEQESTGYFGIITKTATILFQQRYGIQPTSGFVGSLTRAKLNELFA